MTIIAQPIKTNREAFVHPHRQLARPCKYDSSRLRVASPWVRAVAGPQRGQSFRECGPGQRVWARGESEKVAVDLELRAAGFRLLSAPTGSTIE